jgi:phosphoribosylformylglycinamidine synthase
VNAESARNIFAAVHRAIAAGLVRACHDLSEGGLAAAAAEMAFAGGFGGRLDIGPIAAAFGEAGPVVALFSESNTRFLCEVPIDKAADFERELQNSPFTKIGEVTADDRLQISAAGRTIVDANIYELKAAWQATFRW